MNLPFQVLSARSVTCPSMYSHFLLDVRLSLAVPFTFFMDPKDVF